MNIYKISHEQDNGSQTAQFLAVENQCQSEWNMRGINWWYICLPITNIPWWYQSVIDFQTVFFSMQTKKGLAMPSIEPGCFQRNVKIFANECASVHENVSWSMRNSKHTLVRLKLIPCRTHFQPISFAIHLVNC